MVSNYFNTLADRSTVERERRTAAARLLEMSRSSKAKLGTGWKFDRGSIHGERISRNRRSDPGGIEVKG